ncbi:hypothetical protein ABT095_14585 [Kitasatospora sp. NPDC002227]|uniref:hypothetical protein n=1 Tax=Kitasatospora sp. NPDC002227 TaxID=3154773 RepID=UPI00331A33B3
MTDQILAPGAADEGNSTPPDARVITPTRVLPAAEQPPMPDFPPFNHQDRAGLATITDAAPPVARPPVPDTAHDPNPAWWRDLATKAMARNDTAVPETPADLPTPPPVPPVTARVTVRTTIPQQPTAPPARPAHAPQQGAGGGGSDGGNTPPGTGAASSDPSAPAGRCGICGFHCGGDCLRKGQHDTAQPEPDAEPIEQEVTVELTVGDEQAQPPRWFDRIPPVLRPAGKSSGLNRPRVRWAVKYLSPAVVGGGLGFMPWAAYPLEVAIHDPAGVGALVVIAGASAAAWFVAPYVCDVIPVRRWVVRATAIVAADMWGWGMRGEIAEFLARQGWLGTLGIPAAAGAGVLAVSAWLSWLTRNMRPLPGWIARIPMATAIVAVCTTPIVHTVTGASL